MDRGYWDRFYNKPHHDIETPSTFALACLKRIHPGETLFELGCGNGRDALFFGRSGVKVIACDQSDVVISHLIQRASEVAYQEPPEFICTDFSRLGNDFDRRVDVVYSRFTLHAVSAEEASSALAWASKVLKPGGRLFAEARSVKGSLYGVGEPCERDAFVYQGHYRRFIRRDELHSELESLGFAIEEIVESDGLAVYGDDDPVVIRVTAKKS